MIFVHSIGKMRNFNETLHRIYFGYLSCGEVSTTIRQFVLNCKRIKFTMIDWFATQIVCMLYYCFII